MKAFYLNFGVILAINAGYQVPPVVYNPAPILPAYGASSYGSTTQSGYKSGAQSSYDTSSYLGNSNNYASQSTNYGSVGSNYANQASSYQQLGGSSTQYSQVTAPAAYLSSIPSLPAYSLPSLAPPSLTPSKAY